MMQNHLKLHPLSAMLLCVFTTGATWAQEAKNTENPKAPVTELSAITAETPKERTAFDPVIGYVATRSASATRTDTPINEIPHSISVIGAQQIQDQGSKNIPEALRYSAGFNANNFGTDGFGDWFQIRGFASKIFEDGMSETVAISEKGDVRNEPYAYERIEVVRGPNAIISGKNFPGGILNLVSKKPQDTSFNEISLGYGSFNQKRIAADFTGPIDNEAKWLYRLTAVGYDNNTQVDYAKSKRIFLRPSITWRPNNSTELTLFAEYQRDRNNTVLGYLPHRGTIIDRPIGKIPFNRFISEPDWDRVRGIRKRVGWELSKTFNDNWQLKHHFRYSNSNRLLKTIVPLYFVKDSIFVDQNGLPDLDYGPYMKRYFMYESERRNSFTGDLLLQGKFKTGSIQHHTLFALDMSNIHNTSYNFETPASSLNVYEPSYGNYTSPNLHNLPATNNKQKAYGFTLQDQITIADSLLLTGSLRYDIVHTKRNNASQTDHRLSPRLGILWLAGNGFSPYISYSESFNTLFGLRKYNGELGKPVVGKQIEAGLKWQSADKNIQLNAAIFKIKEVNGVVPDLAHPGFIEQTGERTGKGFELEANLNLDNWNILSQYTYTRNYFSKVSPLRINTLNQQMEGSPKHSASLWVVRKFADINLPNLALGAGIVYRGKTGDGSKDGLTIPSSTTIDMMMSYETGPVKFSLNINNLTNKKYLAFCGHDGSCGYASPRNIMGNIAYKW